MGRVSGTWPDPLGGSQTIGVANGRPTAATMQRSTIATSGVRLGPIDMDLHPVTWVPSGCDAHVSMSTSSSRRDVASSSTHRPLQPRDPQRPDGTSLQRGSKLGVRHALFASRTTCRVASARASSS